MDFSCHTVQSKLVIRNGFDKEQIGVKEPFPVTSFYFIRIRDHSCMFWGIPPLSVAKWPISGLTRSDISMVPKEHLVLWNNFRVTKKLLITMFNCKLKRDGNKKNYVNL